MYDCTWVIWRVTWEVAAAYAAFAAANIAQYRVQSPTHIEGIAFDMSESRATQRPACSCMRPYARRPRPANVVDSLLGYSYMI